MNEEGRQIFLLMRMPFAPRAFVIASCVFAAVVFAALFVVQIVSNDAFKQASTWALVVAFAAASICAGLIAQSGAYVRVSGSRVELGLRPLCRVRFSSAEILDVRVVPITEFFREWGVRGRASDDEGLLFAVGELRYGLMFTLRDGRKYGITVTGDGDEIQSLLVLGNSPPGLGVSRGVV